jgi:hypothetical protein
MSFFGKILDKLGLGAAAAQPSPQPAPLPAPQPKGTSVPAESVARPEASAPLAEAPTRVAPQANGSAAVSTVDVAALLEELAAANPQKLNWRTSIVDLLKLLRLDSGLAVRKDLAAELGCPAELMGDSAAMNTWLHKTVLRKLAENGGQIPRELLD